MMRIIFALVLICATPLYAQEREQEMNMPNVVADPDIAFDCLTSGKTASDCAGAMTVVCMAENDLGNPNLNERLCVIEEANLWRELVAGQVRDVSGYLIGKPADFAIGEPRDAFVVAQSDWQHYVISECRFQRVMDATDPRRAINENTCQRDLNAARYDALARIGQQVMK